VAEILLIHSSATMRLHLEFGLEQQGWNVFATGTLQEGLIRMSHLPYPDAVVVDRHLLVLHPDAMEDLRRNVTKLPILVTESGVQATDELVNSLRRALVSTRAVGRLLVVDDSPTYRMALTDQLENAGYVVDQASDADDALSQVAKTEFDAILVDLQLPGMDGLELCSWLNRHRLQSQTQFGILMLTAHEGTREVTRGLEAGADDFVGKSDDPTILQARLRALLRRKFVQEENVRMAAQLQYEKGESTRMVAEKTAAETRAALAGKLEIANRELEDANHRLREAQTHLVHSEKMISLGQLTAGIAHEINNPMAFVLSNCFSIQGWLDKIGPEAQPHLSPANARLWEKTHSRLSDMRLGLERVKELVLKLRTFSRLDEGDFKVVNLQECIDSVLMFLEHLTRGRIEVQRNYGEPASIGCFPGLLNQVLMNVIFNGIEAIKGPGTIAITTGLADGWIRIRIADSGMGVPAELREKIFEPFFTTKPVGQGTGLGLAISYGIMRKHEGNIEIESRPEGGTQFVLSIPVDLEQILHKLAQTES
jgi:two-component system NtrC family sensor kinase